jgi:hypothetical protein
MFKIWIKNFFILVGIVLLFFIAINIQKPFWKDSNYIETVLNFQKDQDIFPYKIRKIWWNKSIIITSIIERTIDIIWTDYLFFLPLIYFLFLIKKRNWLILILCTIGVALISIENDPNPGKYLFWLSPFVISGLI